MIIESITKPLLVVKESRPDESRVALVPDDVRYLVHQGFKIFIEIDAGVAAGFSNQDYLKAGAQILDLKNDRFPSNITILRIKRGSLKREKWELSHYSKQTVIMGFLDPLKSDTQHIHDYAQRGTSSYSLELVSKPKNPKLDASGAMSCLAGPLALDHGIKSYEGDHAPDILILGTGPVARSVANIAIQLYKTVSVLGKREKHRDYFEGIGCQYAAINDLSEQVHWARQKLEKPNIIIAAARNAGQKAPLIIDQESLALTHPDTVIVDVCGEGGNVFGKVTNQTIRTDQGVIIISVTGYPKKYPTQASIAYSRHLREIVLEFYQTNYGHSSSFFKKCWMTIDGTINPKLQ